MKRWGGTKLRGVRSCVLLVTAICALGSSATAFTGDAVQYGTDFERHADAVLCLHAGDWW